MNIGTGIAVVGIWLFPCVCALSKSITSKGLKESVVVASIFTIFITQQQHLMIIFGS